MLRMLPGLALRLFAALVPLALTACADTLTSGQPSMATNAELQRDYDKTMTKTEQAAAISDLAEEKARQEQAIGQNGSSATGATAPTSISPAASAKAKPAAQATSSKTAAPVTPSNQSY
jgi:hypothetical protein